MKGKFSMVHFPSDITERFRFYSGRSMFPLLKTGDLLEIQPIEDGLPRRGDVILFRPPGEECDLVHRVVRTDGKDIYTKGDYAGKADPWCLQMENICGKVSRAWRGKEKLRIHGGPRGRITALLSEIRILFQRISHKILRFRNTISLIRRR